MVSSTILISLLVSRSSKNDRRDWGIIELDNWNGKIPPERLLFNFGCVDEAQILLLALQRWLSDKDLRILARLQRALLEKDRCIPAPLHMSLLERERRRPLCSSKMFLVAVVVGEVVIVTELHAMGAYLRLLLNDSLCSYSTPAWKAQTLLVKTLFALT
ncbi:hypothetical protein CFOL_v3_14324 [Cephalotus follicularis]|uniref:Uncharacterized protein n=1 Tax=Cephalotus follicularis TaxID=3775 RepID=A0A1Q3BS69_CEPFO|nr:hypothetical protein CFOL_v3_14324 [Cephalotus follicularis]